MSPPVTPEDERKAATGVMQVDGVEQIPSLDSITRLASYAFDAPVAFVSILGDVKQRFVSRMGLPMAETCMRSSICAHAVTASEVFVVPDLARDPRFSDNPLVTHDPHLRFYAGAPLIARNGVAIGALCIMDKQPRSFSERDCEQLTNLAQLAIGQLELRNMSGRLDPVSGMPSRHQLHADFPGLVAHAGPGTLYAVVVDVLDIPHASQVGQVLGLRPLEVMIRRAGVRLRNALEGIATVYHVGVTRFAFLVASPSAAQVETLVSELRSRMLRPLMAAAVPMSPRFHAGILPIEDPSESSHELLRKLLVSLFGAFDAQQPLCWYSQTRDSTVQRAYRLASEADRGLQNGEFHLEYQPRFDARTRAPVAAEALIRWNHPVLGPVGPAEFIPVFEQTALMERVTNWVLDAALDQLRDWRAEGLDIPLSINLPSSYLASETAWPVIAEKLSRRSIPCAMVEFEITEGAWLSPDSPAVGQITAMAQAGVNVSIDDFGSGYSNFSYLSDLPIRTIKLDKSLIDRVATDQRSRAKVSAIHHLAHELGYLTVAEGVEHPDQLAALTELGLDQIQGFLLAKPAHPAVTAACFARTAGQPPRAPQLPDSPADMPAHLALTV